MCDSTIECRSCEGSGVRILECRTCEGTGEYLGTCINCEGSGKYYKEAQVCFQCNGSGQVAASDDLDDMDDIDDIDDANDPVGYLAPTRVLCPRCNGTGNYRPEINGICFRCDGEGRFRAPCRKCNATGSFKAACNRCRGTGRIRLAPQVPGQAREPDYQPDRPMPPQRREPVRPAPTPNSRETIASDPRSYPGNRIRG